MHSITNLTFGQLHISHRGVLAGVKRIKNTRNEEISTSTFQKHILLLWTDLYEKSYNAAKTVGEEGNRQMDLIRKNGDIHFKGKTGN